jgi:diguanylate cyclase (GGDEF)-like protein/PAS domain S-box-containing protein
MVQKISQLVELFSGNDLLLNTLQTVYQRLKPSHCFVAAVESSNMHATTLCYLKQGQQTENFSYALSGSPCELVCRDKGICYFPREVQRFFPDDIALAALSIQGYLGTLLRSHDNQVVGLLVCLFEQPIIEQDNQTEWLSELSYFIAQELWQQQSNATKQRLLDQLEAGERLAKVGSWRWDIANDVYSWSNEVYRIFEIDAAADELSYKQVYQYVHPDDRQRFKQIVSEVLLGRQDKYDIIHRVILASGQVKYLHKLADVKKSNDGKVAYMEGTVQDITQWCQLNLDKKLSDFALNNTSESVMITNNQNKIVFINKAMEQLTGYTQAELLGRNPSVLSSDNQSADFYQQMWQTLSSTGHWKGELWNKRKNGQIYPEELSLNAVKNEQGEVSHYVAIFRDISEWKATERKLRFLADCDPLTGLSNRRCFIEQLERQLATAKDDTLISVVFIDLDQFKAINDIYGHEIGDLLLCEVANRLSQEINENDVLCRYGGDEFTLLLPNTSTAQTQIIVKKIQHCFQHLFKLKDFIVDVTASIGVAMYPDAGTSAKLLLRHANHAMHAAKSTGRNGISFHDTESQRRYQYKLELKERLKIALEKNQLTVFYQPIVDIKSNQIAKFEALVRWPDSDGGYISPAEFIPIAEEFGFIHRVGNFVLKQACIDLKSLHLKGFDNISFSINRSISEFFHDELEQQSIATVIKAAGLPYESIAIEITESTAMSANHYAKQALAQLKRKGIKIALDDFCTGYSSLNYLIDYEVDIIKIDRSFVNAIGHDKNSQILTSTVIELASKLGIEVIAEGVENDQQLAFLRQNGCRYIQGFYFSPALPIADCLALLGEDVGGAIWDRILKSLKLSD